jgi:hypothetical protein
VAKWTIPDRVSVAYDTITFFAADNTREPHLAASLHKFSPSLPAEVKEHSVY